MKVCSTEIMKMLKELAEQKYLLLSQENDNSTVSYKEGEAKIPTGYNYETTRKTVRLIDDRVRYLRAVLARQNCTVKVDKFNITVGEALNLLAQLQNEREHEEGLARRRQISRRITANGVVEFTECLYDVNKAQEDARAARETINELQMAIDRANLTNFVEITD